MAYTFANLKTDLRSYTEVDDTVLTDAICSTITKKAYANMQAGFPKKKKKT